MAVVLVRCPECRADNATGARSCIVCLHPLPAAAADVPAAAATPGPTPAARETIALAFLDDELQGRDGADRETDAASICTAVFAVLVVVACLATVCWSLVAA